MQDLVWPWSLRPLGPWLLGLVALALAGLTVWTYRGVNRANGRRVLVILGLRLLALVLACLMIMRPSLAFRADAKLPSTLLIALDRSRSMDIQDEYGGRSRWDAMQELLMDCTPHVEKLRDEHNVSVILYQFAEDAREFDPNGKADGRRTDFGQMLQSLYKLHGRDRNLRGLLILSDGADNGTRVPALTEAARWRGLPCPISTFALGKPTTSDRQRDIAFTAITPEPSPVYAKGKLTVKGVLDAPGFETTPVTVRLFINDKEVQNKQETLTKAAGNEVALVTDAPAQAGEIKVTLKVDPVKGETSIANNEIATYATVTKEGVSVLFVDKLRFPEPQLICDALSADPRIRLYMAWRRGDEAEAADLFQLDKQHYDVIILGDVSATGLKQAANDEQILAKIHDLVRDKGTGLLMMGGYQSFGNSDWNGTPIAKLLPVELSEVGQIEEQIRLEPTPEGLSHFTMRLHDDPEWNRLLWGQLPELKGATRLGPKKPGATVLAALNAKEPLLAWQNYNEGRTMAFAGDTTWRWLRLGQPKSSDGVAAHARFWRQIVLWLAKQDKVEGSAWVKLDARRLSSGSKLGFTVGLRGKGGIDLSDAQFEVVALDPLQAKTSVPTAREPGGERGTFWRTDAAGEYRLVVRGKGKDTDGQAVSGEASARFLIYEDEAEMVRRAADHDFLSKLAHAGGGEFHRAQELPDVLMRLQKQPLPQETPKLELWPDWRRNTLSGFLVGFFFAFVAVLSLEWGLRRFWGLV
jgi:uncharacterized membrane protein